MYSDLVSYVQIYIMISSPLFIVLYTIPNIFFGGLGSKGRPTELLDLGGGVEIAKCEGSRDKDRKDNLSSTGIPLFENGQEH